MERSLKLLLQKYINGTLSIEEAEKLLKYLEDERQKPLVDHVLYEYFLTASVQNSDDVIFRSIQKHIATSTKKQRTHPKFLIRYASIAAACLTAIALGVFFYYTRTAAVKKELISQASDILPGTIGGVINIDGKSITLHAGENNNIIPVTGPSRVKFNDGVLRFETKGLPQKPKINTVETPKGKELKLVLPDGTQIWLNAGSAIRFPSAFNATERVVELSGEAFFDVRPHIGQAFIVKVINNKLRGAQIRVTGTRFNVNAYTNNNAVTTTLVEGSVTINSNHREQVLVPGQQALIPVNTQQITNPVAVETDIASAWKNGHFKFENEPLPEILKQLERWYDITVEYEQQVPTKKFTGTLSRSLSLKTILNTFKSLDINYSIKGRTLYITK